MEKKKIVLLFLDLEGTILREEDGLYDDEEMYYFLEQIDKLQKNTNAQVKIHLVSPVYKDVMEKIMYKIDMNIHSYNRIHRGNAYIKEIEGAACYPEEEMQSEEFEGDRIVPLKRPINSQDFDTARYGKAHYVRNWYEAYDENVYTDIGMCIYCGNGRNDIAAIDYVNSRKNGFAVCPNNSRTDAKKRAFFVSEKTDLLGITEGIGAINERIEKRNVEQDINTKETEEEQK